MLRVTDRRVAVTPLPQIGASEALWTPGQTTTFDRNREGEVEACTRGKVIAKGPKCRMDFEIGDVVQFSDSCSNEFEKGGQKYRILTEFDILGVEEWPQ